MFGSARRRLGREEVSGYPATTPSSHKHAAAMAQQKILQMNVAIVRGTNVSVVLSRAAALVRQGFPIFRCLDAIAAARRSNLTAHCLTLTLKPHSHSILHAGEVSRGATAVSPRMYLRFYRQDRSRLSLRVYFYSPTEKQDRPAQAIFFCSHVSLSSPPLLARSYTHTILMERICVWRSCTAGSTIY